MEAGIAAAVAAVVGVIDLIFLILELVTAWKVFEKYGEKGWKGLIPFYSDYIEFGKVWTTTMGIAYIVLTIVKELINNVDALSNIPLLGTVVGLAAFIITVLCANKKAKSFGKGIGLTIVLVLVPFIGNLYIGFKNDVQYIGNTTEQ